MILRCYKEINYKNENNLQHKPVAAGIALAASHLQTSETHEALDTHLTSLPLPAHDCPSFITETRNAAS